MKHEKIKVLVRTALLLALCVVFQHLKFLSAYLTGPLVNLVLIIAAWFCGWGSGLAISVLASVIAALIGATPVLKMIPAMIPVIMAGNAILAMAAWFTREKYTVVGLILGSCLKAAFLWLVVWYAVLPVFGADLPEKMVAAVKTSFSLQQLITALIGSALALAVRAALGKYLKGKKAE